VTYSNDQTPDEILDRLRDDATLLPDQREAWLSRLVERFPADLLLLTIQKRFADLSGDDAEAIFRLAEAYGDEQLYRELARALVLQTDLPAERSWEALSLLDQAGVLDEHESLLERWEDLNETIDNDASLETLAAQLEGEDDGPWLALQGLSVVEPEIRAEIIAGLADLPGGPGLIEFLRLLTYAHEPSTRWAALDALDDRSIDDPNVRTAWSLISRTHPDPGVVERALEHLGEATGNDLVSNHQAPPQIVRSLITAVDGEGRATIVLAARDGTRWAGAAFLCHVLKGIVEVVGQDGIGDSGLEEAFVLINDQSHCDMIENQPELALQLLAGSLSLCEHQPGTTPALRYWIERTCGQSFQAKTANLFGDWDASTFAHEEMRARAHSVIAACPNWVDQSDLTTDLAREIALREPGATPDPKRDAGAYRYFFEHRFMNRIELYQRMLLWMAAFWRASDRQELGQSALALAWQLGDPQHAVPGHAFFIEYATANLTTRD
jgi:hypothetical protein